MAPLNNLACRQAVEYAANKTDLQTAWGGPYVGGQIATTLLILGMGVVLTIKAAYQLAAPAV